jgi:predicted regulator of Ras-like GTPase activity (Roadblock/LC7/MglB family)
MSKLDRENILNELVSFEGISHGCIYQNEQIIASTFPSIIQDKLSGMGGYIEKIFTTAHAIDQAHDEIHIELEENTLITYRVNDDFLLILMATKGINLSLVYMTVKAIEKSVKLHGLTPAKNTAPQPVPSKASNEKKVPNDYRKEDIPVWPLNGESEDTPSELTSEQKVERYTNGLKKILLESFGPVGDIIFDEALQRWQASHPTEVESIAKLVDLITQEIDSKNEKRSFFNKAARFIRRPLSEIGNE